MKLYLQTIGCRLNQAEIETLARQLLAAGHEIVSDAAQADKVVVNSCAVTAAATRDSRRLTRRLQRQNDQAEIFLTGCYATIAPNEVSEIIGTGQVVPNQQKSQLIQILDPLAATAAPIFDQEPILREWLNAGNKLANTRAFVKVQDGCNHKCTFCVTTVARGAGQSRHLGDVVAEIQTLHAAGYQEAVLTGVHLGSYGHDFGEKAGLRNLVQAILDHTDIPRLRLSSLEPWDIPPDFFKLWQNPRLLPHLHLPLQAGCDRTLRRMARRTRVDNFRKIVAEAHADINNLNMTTDIITGFPGETESDFQESLDYVREIGFSRLHVFSYSPRSGTAAAGMSGQNPPHIIKARTRKMINLGEEMGLTYHQQFVGKTLNVLWEQSKQIPDQGQQWTGYTDNYIRVNAGSPLNHLNQITQFQPTKAQANGLVGKIVAAKSISRS